MRGRNHETGSSGWFGPTDQVREALLAQASPDQAKTILARDAVATKYCEEHGISRDDLSVEQLLEIRALPEWKNA